tara:strand:+ start:3246 stop:4898 length:1653 start_codon:yes stop_codon:yes gene_type:complete
MAINLSDNILAQTTKPADAKYGPFSASSLAQAKADALSLLITNFRYQGLTVGLVDTSNSPAYVQEWWFKDGVLDSNLEEKTSSNQGGAIEILQTGTSVSTAVSKIDVNSVAGKGLIAQGKPLTTITTNPTGITTDGTYPGLTTTSSGSPTAAAVVSAIVSGGTVSSVTITTAGAGYAAGDTLVVSSAQLAGSTVNLVVTLDAADFSDGSLMPTQISLDTIYDTQLSSTQLSVAVGGVVANTPVSSFAGDSLVDVLNKILFPTQLPRYSAANLSTATNISTVFEVGSTIAPTVTATANTQDGGAFTEIRIIKTLNGTSTTEFTGIGSPATIGGTTYSPEFGFTSPNAPNQRYTSSYTDSIALPAPSGSNTSTSLLFKSTADNSQGQVKKNSAGNDDTRSFGSGVNAPQAASTKTSNIISIAAYYPIFYGTGSTLFTISGVASLISAGSAGTKVITNGGASSISMNFGTSTLFHYFAIPAFYADKRSWFVTTLNQGGIGQSTNPPDAFSAGVTAAITSTGISPGWSSIDYKIYITPSASGLGTATLIRTALP